jgi:hypothetical protein
MNHIYTFYEKLYYKEYHQDSLKQLFFHYISILENIYIPKQISYGLLFWIRDKRNDHSDRTYASIMFLAVIYCVYINKTIYQDDFIKLFLTSMQQYGCYSDIRDVCNYVEHSVHFDEVTKNKFYVMIVRKIIEPILLKDMESEHPSMLSKWMPREHSKFDWLAKKFAKIMYCSMKPSEQFKLYRTYITNINLSTTEQKMAACEWNKIEPSRSNYLRYQKAFKKHGIYHPSIYQKTWMNIDFGNWTTILCTNHYRGLEMACYANTLYHYEDIIKLEDDSCIENRIKELENKIEGTIKGTIKGTIERTIKGMIEKIDYPFFILDVSNSKLMEFIKKIKPEKQVILWSINRDTIPNIIVRPNLILISGYDRHLIRDIFFSNLKKYDKTNYMLHYLGNYFIGP